MSEHSFRPYTPENEAPPDFLLLLGLAPPITVADVEEAYRVKAQSAHPDQGGSAEEFKQLQTAYEQAKEYASFRASRRQWLAGQMDRYIQQQAVVTELENRGAQVEIQQISWLERSFGDGFASVAEKFVGLDMSGPTFGDDDLDYLATSAEALAFVRRLNLSKSNITNGKVHLLSKMRNLSKLDLSHTRAGSNVISLVQRLPDLRELDISGAKVGWWTRLQLRMKYPGLNVRTDG